MAFIIIPFLDWVLPQDQRQPGEPKDSLYYSLIPVLYVFVQWSLLLLTLSKLETFTPAEWILVWISTSVATGGVGITVAHELIHRTDRLRRWLGQVLLSSVSYTHFSVEHVWGHHANVATPIDPATAKLNQSFYSFWFQSVIGGWISAWNIERTRLGPRWLTLSNRVLGGILLEAVVYGGVFYFYGWTGILFFVLQSILAFTLLEIINYVEHYGLERRLMPNGKYERVGGLHSWEGLHPVANYLLINLQRHSDHHMYPRRPYQNLKHHFESPRLPFNYPLMAIIALYPPLWKKVMNPRIPVRT